jgi:hypothetical protein
VKGFYEQQGWGPNFAIPTRSDFFSPAMNSGNRSFREPFPVNRPVTLRGRAFGGDRSISRVEISFATMRRPGPTSPSLTTRGPS